jgi:hypothetical protein
MLLSMLASVANYLKPFNPLQIAMVWRVIFNKIATLQKILLLRASGQRYVILAVPVTGPLGAAKAIGITTALAVI